MVGSRRGTTTQSPASIVPMGRRTTGRGTQPDASASRAPRRRAGARQSLPRRERTAQVHGLNEQEAEDIDQPSDEEDNTTIQREKAPRAHKSHSPQKMSSMLGIFGDMMPTFKLRLITSVQCSTWRQITIVYRSNE
jgi:hypothetical protein